MPSLPERHLLERPLAKLSDEEVAALGSAAGYRDTFPEPMRSRMSTLGLLADYEERHRSGDLTQSVGFKLGGEL